MDFSFKRSFLNLLFPPLCAHCHERLNQHTSLLCQICKEHLELIDPQSRCPICFSEREQGGCDRCRKRKVVVHRQIATCHSIGPARSLAQLLLKGDDRPLLAIASLMAHRLLNNNHSLPQIIIPLPLPLWQRLKLGKDLHLLLAREVGKILDVPVLPLLISRFDRDHFLRTGVIQQLYTAKSKPQHTLADQRILLLALTLEDLKLREAGIILHQQFPTEITASCFLA